MATNIPFNLGLDIAESSLYSTSDLKKYCLETWNRSNKEMVEWFAIRYNKAEDENEKNGILNALLKVARRK